MMLSSNPKREASPQTIDHSQLDSIDSKQNQEINLFEGLSLPAVPSHPIVLSNNDSSSTKITNHQLINRSDEVNNDNIDITISKEVTTTPIIEKSPETQLSEFDFIHLSNNQASNTSNTKITNEFTISNTNNSKSQHQTEFAQSEEWLLQLDNNNASNSQLINSSSDINNFPTTAASSIEHLSSSVENLPNHLSKLYTTAEVMYIILISHSFVYYLFFKILLICNLCLLLIGWVLLERFQCFIPSCADLEWQWQHSHSSYGY